MSIYNGRFIIDEISEISESIKRENQLKKIKLRKTDRKMTKEDILKDIDVIDEKIISEYYDRITEKGFDIHSIDYNVRISMDDYYQFVMNVTYKNKWNMLLTYWYDIVENETLHYLNPGYITNEKNEKIEKIHNISNILEKNNKTIKLYELLDNGKDWFIDNYYAEPMQQILKLKEKGFIIDDVVIDKLDANYHIKITLPESLFSQGLLWNPIEKYGYNRSINEDKKLGLSTHSYYFNIIESDNADIIYCISTNKYLSYHDYTTTAHKADNNRSDYIIDLELPIKKENIEESLLNIDKLVFHNNFTNEDLQTELSNIGYFRHNKLLEDQQINCSLEFRFHKEHNTYDPNHFCVYGYVNDDINYIISEYINENEYDYDYENIDDIDINNEFIINLFKKRYRKPFDPCILYRSDQKGYETTTNFTHQCFFLLTKNKSDSQISCSLYQQVWKDVDQNYHPSHSYSFISSQVFHVSKQHFSNLYQPIISHIHDTVSKFNNLYRKNFLI